MWDEVPPELGRTSAKRRRRWTAAIPPTLIAVCFLALDRAPLAAVVLIIGLVVTILQARLEGFRHAAERVFSAVGGAVGAVLSFVTLWLIAVVVVLPVSLVAWILRRDPIATAPGPGRWASRPDEVTKPIHRLYGKEPTRSARGAHTARVLHLAPRIVGWLVIALMADFLVGTAMGAGVGHGSAESRSTSAEIARATAGLGWWREYREELDAIEYDFASFVQSKPRDRSGRYVNIENGLRRSWRPTVAGDLPVVAFFGGSTIWGEGQRDLHTVPSQVARLAATNGTPIQVVNYAQRGDVSFTEALRFERAMAANGGGIDLAVFVDGSDDVAVQMENASAQPTHFGLVATETAVNEDRRSIIERYRDTSLVNELATQVRSVFSAQVAAASPVRAATSPEITNALSLYERAIALEHIVATQYDVATRHYWQPVAAGEDDRSQYAEATRNLPDGVLDVSDAYAEAQAPVYLDGVHTNELGARLLAEAIYEDLRDHLSRSAGAAG